MKVTFKHFGAHMASSRYRSIIPQQELFKQGIEVGNDWLVIGKHGWDWDEEHRGFQKVCFDICDDHFGTKWNQHYRTGCEFADLVTCNSEEMRRIILAECGVEATVIPDPYEQPECEPRVHGRVLWFGHQSNLPDLVPWLEGIADIEVVTGPNIPGTTAWTPEAMDRAFSDAGIVVIPTGKSMAKSANRAIESIRRGLFVVAGYLPAYADLGVYIGNIHDGIKWALEHKADAMHRIRMSQNYIAREYSPERIGELWKQALS